MRDKLNDALAKVWQETIEVVGAGRIDTGVHAKQMFAHFLTIRWPLLHLELVINSFVPAYFCSLQSVCISRHEVSQSVRIIILPTHLMNCSICSEKMILLWSSYICSYMTLRQTPTTDRVLSVISIEDSCLNCVISEATSRIL